MLNNYLKIAWRSIVKNKATAFINITGLSVGLSSAILILIWVQNELNFDNYHPGSERIYRLTSSIKENNLQWETTPLLLADATKEVIPEIESIARLNTDNRPVLNINNILISEKKAAYVDKEWFRIFQYDFIEGSPTSFLKNENSIILTAAAAEKYFGNKNAMGATIRIDSLNYQVAAIVKNAASNSSFQYEVFIPLSALLHNSTRRKNDENWANFNYLTFVKLKQGSNAAATAQKLTDILPDNAHDQTSISLMSLKDMHFEDAFQYSIFIHGQLTSVYVFSVLAFLLLLVACINYINLTTAKAILRAKEVSVRKIVGAKRRHLFYQFATEALLISMISLASTLVLIQFSMPAFNALTGKNFVFSLSSPTILGIIGSTLLSAFVLNSIYPALSLSSFKPLSVFRGTTILNIKDSQWQKFLVIVQFTISIILIMGTIVIYRQMQFIKHTDPGYNRSQLVTFPLPPDLEADKRALLVDQLKHELQSQSSVVSISSSNNSIENIGSMSSGFDWNGRNPNYNPTLSQLSADADFQKTMQLQMKTGRWFIYGNHADKNHVVLNETAVPELNIPKPVIGQRFTFKGRTGEIIGIVKDFNFQSLHQKTTPLVVFNDPNWFNYVTVRIRPNHVSNGVAAVQKTWENLILNHPFEYNFIDDNFNSLYKEDEKVSSLIFVFAIIAVLISSLGLFSLATHTIQQRYREIGIRKVLGATVTGITCMLSKEFLVLVAISIALATPIAFWATHTWLNNFAYRIEMSWWMFGAAGGVAIVISLATVSFQAIKAALANPIKNLRTE